MKILRIIAFILIPLACGAQDWFGVNDEWVNTLSAGYSGGTYGFEEISVAGDTVISNKTYKILERRYARHVLGKDTLFRFYEPH